MPTLTEQLRAYDPCFQEFLKASGNGQKWMQAIVLREGFAHFRDKGIGVQTETPTDVLDVSCGPGFYSAQWTSGVASSVGQMGYYCTDFSGGFTTDPKTGKPIHYTEATKQRILDAAAQGKLTLSGDPVGVVADLFSGADAIMPPGKKAHVGHWSHSVYHVKDALGADRDDETKVTAGVNTAVDKILAALDPKGIMICIHQTNDLSDGQPSEMFPISKRFLGVIDNGPERIERRIKEQGGFVSTVNFATPLNFSTMPAARWEPLKDPKRWDTLGDEQARVLRLLGFIGYDFSDSTKSGLEKLAEAGRLGEFVDAYREPVSRNKGHIFVKCGFQMGSKSPDIAAAIETIAQDLRARLPEFKQEMAAEMLRATMPRPDAG